jgi:hypothetical protein
VFDVRQLLGTPAASMINVCGKFPESVAPLQEARKRLWVTAQTQAKGWITRRSVLSNCSGSWWTGIHVIGTGSSTLD